MAVSALLQQSEEGLYPQLIACSSGLPNDEWLARMMSGWADGAGALPGWMGLDPVEFNAMIERHFPGVPWPAFSGRMFCDPARIWERNDLRQLLLGHLAGLDKSEEWIASIVAAACMGDDHLWQDLGLWSRGDLSRLMTENFPRLAAGNNRNMKWKKFLYKQLCNAEGIYVCRSPSCAVCSDFDHCFGPEE